MASVGGNQGSSVGVLAVGMLVGEIEGAVVVGGMVTVGLGDGETVTNIGKSGVGASDKSSLSFGSDISELEEKGASDGE